MQRLDWLCLTLLAGNLAATREALEPGERVTLRRYLQRRLPATYAREIAARLRAREFYLWIDGRPVVYADLDVVVERDSRVLLFVRTANAVRIIEPDPEAALN
jgi:hypothetical protein